MKKLLAIAGIIFLCSHAVAEAQQRYQYQGNRGGYGQSYRGGNYRNNGNRYVQNNYYGGRGYRGGGWNNGGAIAAGVGLGLLGGLIGGALINQQPAYAAPPVVGNCQEMWVWDQYGNKMLRMVCQ